MAYRVERAEPVANQVDAMLTDLEDRVNRSLDRLELTDEVIQLCILRITKELIMKSARSRGHHEQLHRNAHYSCQPAAHADGAHLPRGGAVAAFAHVQNPSGTTSFTSAQSRPAEGAPHNAAERMLASHTTSGSGVSKGTGSGEGSEEPQSILGGAAQARVLS